MNEAGAADHAPYPGIHRFPKVYVSTEFTYGLHHCGDKKAAGYACDMAK